MGKKHENDYVAISEGLFNDLVFNYSLLNSLDETNPSLGRVKKISNGMAIEYHDPSRNQNVDLTFAGHNDVVDPSYQRSVNEYNERLQKKISEILDPSYFLSADSDIAPREVQVAIKELTDKFYKH
ncbi:MAG: hypothetical protein ACOCU6_01845 [Nanoarchaeota archaeon]